MKELCKITFQEAHSLCYWFNLKEYDIVSICTTENGYIAFYYEGVKDGE